VSTAVISMAIRLNRQLLIWIYADRTKASFFCVELTVAVCYSGVSVWCRQCNNHSRTWDIYRASIPLPLASPPPLKKVLPYLNNLTNQQCTVCHR